MTSTPPTAAPPEPAGSQVPSRGLRRFGLGHLAVAVAALLGIGVRVALYWQDRSFWRDELALVQSLDSYALGSLLGPLADSQSAPPGWLVLERLVTTVLGHGERAYRLLPLLFGCATLVLAGLLCLRLVRRPWTAAIPVLALGTISQLVFYTAQTKQYTADTFLVTGLLLVGVRMVQDGPTRRTEGLWYVGIAVATWFSHGFMLSAPLVAAWVALVQWRRGTRTLRQLAIRLVLPATSVLSAAFWALHLTNQVRDFETYWAPFMRPVGSGLTGLLTWTGSVLADFAIRELGFAAWWGLGFVAGGLAVVLLRRWSRVPAVLLVLPVSTAYLAAVLGGYPFGRRLVLFCVPPLLVLLGVGVDAVVGRIGHWTRRPWIGLVAGLAATVVLALTAWTKPAELAHDLRYGYGVDDYRLALRFVDRKWEPGDVLVMGNGDRAAFRVYGPRLGMPEDRAYRAMPIPGSGKQDSCPLPAQITGAERVWLLSGDLVELYPGEMSRNGLVAPMLDRYRVVHFVDKGLISVQTLLPGGSGDAAKPARCLTYAPVGPAGAPEYPPSLPAD